MRSRDNYTIETWYEQKKEWEKFFKSNFSEKEFNRLLVDWVEFKNFTDRLAMGVVTKRGDDVNEAVEFKSQARKYFAKIFDFKSDQLPTINHLKQFLRQKNEPKQIIKKPTIKKENKENKELKLIPKEPAEIPETTKREYRVENVESKANKMVRACDTFIELIKKTVYREINKEREVISEPTKNPRSLYQFSAEEILNNLIVQRRSPVSAISLAAKHNGKIDELLSEYKAILVFKQTLTNKNSDEDLEHRAFAVKAAMEREYYPDNKKKMKTAISEYFVTLIQNIWSENNEKAAWRAMNKAIEEKGSSSSPKKSF